MDGATLAIEAIEEERKRLARDIHDGPAQLLTNLTMRLEVVKEMIKYSPEKVLPEIARIQDLMRSSVGELRRMIYDLRPIEIAETGLVSALETYAQRCQYLTRIPVRIFSESIVGPLPDLLGLAFFRMVQECITNSLKHAHASQIDVHVSFDQHKLAARVQDDGIGFRTQDTIGQGFGLTGLHERARLIDANVEIESVVGQGTTVTVSLYLEHQASMSLNGAIYHE